jgi:hypothetical protein
MAKLVMNEGVYPDFETLGSRLRGVDKLEARLTNKWAPADAIRNSIMLSTKWWIGTINGQEEMAVGVAPLPGSDGWAAPWLLSTDKFMFGAASRDFLKRSRLFVDEAADGYDMLFNIVSANNHDSIRWLRFAGFDIKKEDPHVFGGFPFYEFSRATPGGAYSEL